jgi:hypothetical protein
MDARYSAVPVRTSRDSGRSCGATHVIGAIGDLTDVAAAADPDHRRMTGNRRPRHATREERSFFESLVALRSAYAGRDADDASAAVSIDEAIAAANAMMDSPTRQAPLRLGFAGN